MKFRHLNLLIVVLGLLSAGSALAQNAIFLTKDVETGNPMLVAEPGPGAVLRFQSLNYVDPSLAGAPFLIKFGSEFVGHFNDTAATTSPHAVVPDGVVFSSTSDPSCPVTGGTVPCQVVSILLDNSGGKQHNKLGYKYEVIMGDKVLDPRVRPR